MVEVARKDVYLYNHSWQSISIFPVLRMLSDNKKTNITFKVRRKSKSFLSSFKSYEYIMSYHPKFLHNRLVSMHHWQKYCDLIKGTVTVWSIL